MAVQPSYPGVYIEEVLSGNRTIVGVATSVTAFIGRTARGDHAKPIRCFSFADFERSCGGLWPDSELGYAVYQFFQNGGGDALISRVATGATTASFTPPASTFEVQAANPGSWGENLRLTISHGTAGGLDEVDDALSFHLTVHEVDPDEPDFERSIRAREEFLYVSVDPEAPRYVQRVIEQQSALIRIATVSAARPPATNREALTGGTDGGPGSIADYQEAIDRLEPADIVNMVCVPPPARGADINLAIWTHALAFCQRRRAILLVDPPTSWGDYQDAADLTGLDSLRTSNSAFYYPGIMAPDPLQENRLRRFAPAGAVAGIIARTDGERGVWKAPAGADARIRAISGLEVDLIDEENGVVNGRGVNALRNFSVVGPVVWGARTGLGADEMASEWKYLPVRRLALFIEESLARGTRWAVFEPNDEPLWAQMRTTIGSFMQQLFRQGAFQGSRPSEAYLVRCDATTTIQADIDRGVVNVLVGFAPLKPAEFVVIKFQQIAGRAAG
jgi:phage tail sheath protein FI